MCKLILIYTFSIGFPMFMKKKVTILVVWLVLSLGLVALAMGPFTEETGAEDVQNDKGDQGGNDLDLDKLEPGDIILTRGSKFDGMVPGYWTHAIMYIGDGNVIESIEDGVVVRPVETVLTSNEAGAFRVSTNETVKESVIDFALEQEGKPFDVVWVNKQVHGSSYYCAELIWASYQVNDVEIDENPGWSWNYANGVAPTEIAEHSNTYMVDHSE